MIGVDTLILCFALFVMIVGGTSLAISVMDQYSPLLGISRGVVYAMAPVSGALIVLAQVINLYEDLTGQQLSQSGEDR